MRLVAVMPVYGRPELTRLILRQWHYQMLRLRSRMDVRLVVVGSEGPRSAALVAGYSDTMSYVEAPNDPLNRKWNVGLGVARFLEPDAVLTVGSDDLVSDSLLLAYADKVRAGVDYFGLVDLYFFDAATVRLGHWPGYGPQSMPHRTGEPIGLARCYARGLLESVDWQLWPDVPARSNAMDYASLQHLATQGLTPRTFTLAALNAKAVDVKVGLGITGFDRIPYREVTHGGAALSYLADLVDEAGMTELRTRWRAAA